MSAFLPRYNSSYHCQLKILQAVIAQLLGCINSSSFRHRVATARAIMVYVTTPTNIPEELIWYASVPRLPLRIFSCGVWQHETTRDWGQTLSQRSKHKTGWSSMVKAFKTLVKVNSQELICCQEVIVPPAL